MPVTPTPQTYSEPFDPRILSALQGLDLKARYVMEGFLAGVHASPFHGFSVEFSDYRRYQPGDDLRHLDWRLFARNDRLCIKRYVQETNTRFYVVCDTSASMQYRGLHAWGSKLECSRIVAAALAWLLLKQNDAGGLITLEAEAKAPRFIGPSQRSTQFGLMLQELAQLRPAGGPRLHHLLEHTARLAHRRSLILLFSDLLEPAATLTSSLRQLRFQGHEIVLFQALDRDELEFPFSDPLIFQDLESGHRRKVSPESARQSYLARFNEFMETHWQQCRDLEIPHCLLRTDESPWSALALFLGVRKRLK